MNGIPIPEGASINVGQKVNEPAITFYNLGSKLMVEVFSRDKNSEVKIVTYTDGKNSLQLPTVTVHVLGRKLFKALDAGESTSLVFSLNEKNQIVFEPISSETTYRITLKRCLTNTIPADSCDG